MLNEPLSHGERSLREVALGAQHELVDENVQQLLEVVGLVKTVHRRLLGLHRSEGMVSNAVVRRRALPDDAKLE